MEVVKADDPADGLDEEDRKRYHYVPRAQQNTSSYGGSVLLGTSFGNTNTAKGSGQDEKNSGGANATGEFDDVDYAGNEWRKKRLTQAAEMDYTRLRVDDDDDTEEIHLRTKFLFDEDKAMTPLSQMQATKNLLTEAQRIAYVGVCYLTMREMITGLKRVGRKELAGAIKGLELWSLKIMGRLYFHMEIALPEQKMIETLGEHGLTAMDLVPPLMTTHTVANPEYDPVEARRVQEEREAEDAEAERLGAQTLDVDSSQDEDGTTTPTAASSTTTFQPGHKRDRSNVRLQTTANVLEPSTPVNVPGVSTHLSNLDKDVTLDIRWTVLCDLFLILIADSVYDARSRVLLETVASKLGLGWSEVIKFEKRVTDALEIEEGAESLESQEIIESRVQASKRRRYMMVGLATLGGGLVIGLSAGVLAPVIGAAFGATLTAMGAAGSTAVLTSTGGAIAITATGALTGSGIAAKGMTRRTRFVRTMELLPLHNNRRVNCILTIPGYMNNINDDVRLPFSVLDPMVGDVFSMRWEPEMMEETGNALKILSTEVLSQVSTTVLQFTVLTSIMSAISFPLLLTKLGYLIDNPWSNALDRAKAAGGVLADILMSRSLGVRPITLIGFSLGARMIFYCLLELAKHKAYGIVQDVFLLGATVTAPVRSWMDARSVVAGRFVNGFARNDWILGYLFRATTGGINTVAGMRPVDHVPGLENVDLTDKIAGHLSYRVYMPLILDQLGFAVSADFFDEPEEMMTAEREVIRQEAIAAANKDKKRFSLFSGKSSTPNSTSTPKDARVSSETIQEKDEDDDLPERMPTAANGKTVNLPSAEKAEKAEDEKLPAAKAGFDLKALAAAAAQARAEAEAEEARQQKTELPLPNPPPAPGVDSTPRPAPERTESAPPIPPSASKEVSRSKVLPPSPTTPTAATPYQLPSSSKSETNLHLDDNALANKVEKISISPSFTQSTPKMNDSPYGEYATPNSDPFSSPSGTSLSPGFSQYVSADATTLSFGSVDGDVWTPAMTTGSTLSKVGTESIPATPFGAVRGTDDMYASMYKADPMAYKPFASTGFGGGGGFGYPASTPNPFASSTLSFGGVDGSVSLGSSGTETKDVVADSWAPKPIVSPNSKQRPAYTINPWET